MRFVVVLAKAAAAMLAMLVAADVGLAIGFPHLPRLQENFSSPYLLRALRTDKIDQKIVFLGDSVIWGYGLPATESVTARLETLSVPVENLSYEGGSAVNTYGMLRLLQVHGIRPKAVFFNVNVKEFNHFDSAYRTLYPALERLVFANLSSAERRNLTETQVNTLDARIDRALARAWLLYGMRSDIREYVWHAPDMGSALLGRTGLISGTSAREVRAHVPTPARFLGTYDLTPLTLDNVEVAFLQKAALLLAREHIRAYAMLTPTNHELLHEYIDVPEYQSQIRYLSALLRANGVRVLDYDRIFAGSAFLDNDHLTAAATAQLAARIKHDLAL